MFKSPTFLTKSIRNKYMKTIVASAFIVISLIILFFLYVHSANEKVHVEREVLLKKAEIIDELEESFNGIFFRARGYYAFQNAEELALLYENLEKFERHLASFSSLDLTSEEREMYNNLASFSENYKSNILPKAIGYVAANDYESLRALSSGGANDLVNNFVAFTKDFNHDTDKELNSMFTKIFEQSIQFTEVAIALFSLVFLLFILFVYRVLNDLIRPVEHLTVATKALAKGRTFELSEVGERKDEIGALSRSFIDMSVTIHEKEEVLTAQNEELIAQQEELEENQARLQTTLTEVESMTKALNQSSVVIVANADGVIIDVNEMFCEHLQYKRDEIIGKSYRLFTTDFHSAAFYEEIWKTLSGGDISVNEMRCLAKDKSQLWFQVTIVPYLDNHGIPYRYILVGNNITATKEMQNKLSTSLFEAEMTRNQLEKYNQLNHALTFTLDKQDFLHAVHQYLHGLYNFDASMMYLLHFTLYVSKGLSEESSLQIIENFDSNKRTRLEEEKTFVIKRQVGLKEKGIARETYDCFDLYSAVLDKNGKPVAVFMATREGHPFTPLEISEISGLMNRLSIAFERILMYEAVERSRQLNQDIIDNVNEGIQFVSTSGEIIQLNKSLRKMVRDSEWANKDFILKEDWLNFFLSSCSAPETLQQFFEQSIYHEFKETQKTRYSTNHEFPNFYEVYATSVFEGEKKVGTVFVHRDITKEHEIDRMKSELVSTVSHELRTPLSSVLGFTELLLTKTLKPERQKKYIETVHKEAKRLTNLINDFLDLQRMESGRQQYTMQQIQLDQLAIEATNRFRHETNHHVQLIDKAKYVTVNADQERLMQLFMNLIGNAIKFSPEGGEVKILLENVDEMLQVSIKDNGIGIPKAQIANLFQKFKRIDNSLSRKIGGTGLGLAISKEIITVHGGEIWLESNEGEGTTVFFTLPLAENMTNVQDHQQAHELSNQEGFNIMIVEDDSSQALLLSDELKSKGFTVIHHYDPKRAFEHALTIPLVGIVIDLMLGETMNGWELVKKLKETPETSEIPIVISSALDISKENMDVYKIEKYLTKPYPPEELSKVISQFLSLEDDSSETSD